MMTGQQGHTGVNSHTNVMCQTQFLVANSGNRFYVCALEFSWRRHLFSGSSSDGGKIGA